MRSIPAALIPIKNARHTSDPFLIFLQMELDGSTYRIVDDMIDQTWNGYTWAAFPFEITEFSEGNGQEVPSMNLILANPMRIFQSYFEEANGTAAGTVTIYILHASSLASGLNDVLNFLVFKMGTAVSTGEQISVQLTADNVWQKRCPGNRIRRNYCRWRFKSTECGYSGVETECDKTLQDCEARSNEDRFGAFPGAGRGIPGLRV